jgi:hypothetical protein
VNIDAAVTDVLDRLGDLANAIWTRDEAKLHYKDGYDTFCRRTRCFFDVVAIENLPPVGNWQTDLERYLALQRSGWGVTDMPFHFTAENERSLGHTPLIGGSYSGPSAMTSPSDSRFASTVDGSAGGVPTTCPGGLLPQTTVELQRVMYNSRTLTGSSSQHMRKMDPNYENLTGDPQFYLWDQDGLYFMRFVPAASGDADYPEVNGGFGTLTQTVEETNNELYDALTNYWRMEEVTGSGNRADQVGSAPLVPNNPITQVAGKLLFASFVPSTDNMATSLIPTGTPFSYSFWVKFNTLTVSDADLFFLLDSPGAPFIQIRHETSGTLTLTDGTASSQVTVALAAGTFHHLVLTHSGTVVSLYFDGVLATSINSTVTPTTRLLLGQNDDASITFDEMGRFNVVLSQAQIDILYNSGDGTFYPDFGGSVVDTVVTTDVNGLGTGGFGILSSIDGIGSLDTGTFPSGGPWGTPTQLHPDANNFRIEIARLGRCLDFNAIELPTAYQRYVTYWTMAQLLRRDGPGQDIELADHYESRFEMGVARMEKKRNEMNRDRQGILGAGPQPEPFGMGLPTLPYPYDRNQWT